jgi:hypothetical protein
MAGQLTYINLLWDDVETTCNDLFGFRVDSDQRISYSSDKTIFLGGDKVIDMNDEIHGLYVRTSLTTDGTLNSETGTFSNILSRIIFSLLQQISVGLFFIHHKTAATIYKFLCQLLRWLG